MPERPYDLFMAGGRVSRADIGSVGPVAAPLGVRSRDEARGRTARPLDGARSSVAPRGGARSTVAPRGGARSTVAPRGGARSTVPVGAGSVASRVAGVRVWLSSVDGECLSDRERVDLVAELERLKGAASASQARATDRVRCSREQVAPRDAARSVGCEVALARRESPALGDRFVGLSRALVHEMPATMRALTGGVIGERHAVAVVAATAALSRGDRAEVDRRVGPLLGRLGVGAAGRAARRVAAELDAASVVARMEAAARSRRVTVRPAPDGMAYLSVLAPLRESVGAYAALRARATAVVAGQCPDEAPDGRGVGAVMADTATRLLSGRAVGQVQPLEVHLVITDTALLGPDARSRAAAGGSSGAPTATRFPTAAGCPTASAADRPTAASSPDLAASPPDLEETSPPHPAAWADPVMEPARIPGHGSVPAPVARRWVRDAGDGSVWLRRLYTAPEGRDLVAMDSRRRVFTGLLRRMLVLRDDVCSTPWCDGVIAHADHTRPVRDGGPTDLANGGGRCARCNYVKEAPGWSVRVTRPGPSPELEVTTPLGRRYRSHPPPLLGWGWQPRGPAAPRRPAQHDTTTDRATEPDTEPAAALRRGT